ncbi:Imidazole glycerol phosphate synthase subunit HisH 1 [Rubripirellula lacrimiformis]|uniref:Imidazole glycerol phosphate synthase subunit HisH n=1 Tax=Rubripirellula lacrimiformis TaxID=1930273 RepID=A0A517NLE0_9BACT|nr:imidazole glycerol phosphate synthase subunit HisH [Rubripirellula lacrimiformis]QDT07899.1 Imidazole glycerol phosphate synthase subunit HisH 1 [Rubripirellula lacrimiformis]
MITIVDYQMGNLRSVQKAIERVGGEAKISSDPVEISAADKLVLPGVGAFGDAMAEIRRRDLAQPIIDFVATGRPFLGICLGLQLLFETGLEHGEHEGLGILKGDVVRFEPPVLNSDSGQPAADSGQPAGPILKVPHMGWNTVTKRSSGPILDDIQDGSHFYFVHSYYVRPTDPDVVALTCDYGHEFCAMVRKGNLLATQFHPEKSQADGLKLLAGFNGLSTDAEVSA